MQMDYLTLGPTPADESCEQADGCRNKIRRENNAYKRQLERMFPIPDALQSVRFSVKSFPHDFGSYTEVVVHYDCDDETAVEFAFNVESNLPANWDAQAEVALMPKFGETLERDLANTDARYTREQLK